MLKLNLDDYTLDDLKNLEGNQVERNDLEYKSSLPKSDKDKYNFLKAVCGLANSSGGDLIIGIADKPVRLQGVDIEDLSRIQESMDSLVTSSIEPSVHGVRYKEIKIDNTKSVIVARVPRSWNVPHRLNFGSHKDFYLRENCTTQPLAIPAIKQLFLLSETLSEKIRDFRVERITNILTGDTPVLLDKGMKLVLNIIPLNTFDSPIKFDLLDIRNKAERLYPIFADGCNFKYNFDGYLAYHKSGISTDHHSYLQVFKNGMIENVSNFILDNQDNPSYDFEDEATILKKLQEYLTFQEELGVSSPLIVMLSFLETKGSKVYGKNYSYRQNIYLIERKDLIIPEILIEDYSCNLAEKMKPVFDSVWNACGNLQSCNYDENGKWINKNYKAGMDL